MTRRAPCAPVLAALSLAIAGAAAAQEWTPSGPINIIVPWGAGGSTDQVTRVTAPIISEQLGVPVVVVNQPGASGAIGTQAVLDAPKNGLTWTANAIANNATYAVSGLLEGTSIDDWHIYLSVANAPLISVPADSEFQDFGQLLAAFRERGDEITVATAGVTSSGGTAIATLAQHGDFPYRMVAYDGGGPAAIATAAGEAMVTTQLAVEQTELVRGGRLRPLAVMSDRPLTVEGIDPVPPVTEWIDMPLAPDYFGIFIPKGVPEEVVATMDRIWAEHVMTSDELQTYAETFGAVFDPSYGEEARAKAMPIVIQEACSMVERGEAVNPPSVINVDCETMSEVTQ
jgi:tripartite-type tricarboxylate transporter receptor subunit TctC